MEQKWKNIRVSSGFGSNTREPFVQIDMDYPKEHPLQIHPDEARDLAMNLLQAADAADSDEFIFLFFSKIMGGSDNAGAKSLIEFRKFRDERRG